MNIAIVDDDKNFIEELKSQVIKTFHDKMGAVLVETFNNPTYLLINLEEKKIYDVYFLDIEMPECNGIKLSKKIRDINEDAVIVFVSSHHKYVFQGYEVAAYRYIIKNEMISQIPKILLDIYDEFIQKESKFYFIKTNTRYERIKHSEIYYIYKEKKYAVIATKSMTSRVRNTLQNVLVELNSSDFLFVERGYIVNLKRISSIEGNILTLDSGQELIIGRKFIDELKSQLKQIWLGE